MGENENTNQALEIIPWLQKQKVVFEDYIKDVAKHKLKMLNPKVQSQVMASSGVIAFINEMLKSIEKGEIKL